MYNNINRNVSGVSNMYKKDFKVIEEQCDSLCGEGKLQEALDIIEKISSESV